MDTLQWHALYKRLIHVPFSPLCSCCRPPNRTSTRDMFVQPHNPSTDFPRRRFQRGRCTRRTRHCRRAVCSRMCKILYSLDHTHSRSYSRFYFGGYVAQLPTPHWGKAFYQRSKTIANEILKYSHCLVTAMDMRYDPAQLED